MLAKKICDFCFIKCNNNNRKRFTTISLYFFAYSYMQLKKVLRFNRFENDDNSYQYFIENLLLFNFFAISFSIHL